MSLVAWVESPLQLVNAVEHAHALGEPTRILVRSGVATLDDVAGAIEPSLPEGTMLERGLASAFTSRAGRARSLLAGDLYSGQLRVVLAAGPVKELVVVDDGAAMLSLAEQLATGAAATRPANAEGILMRSLGGVATRRVRALMAEGRVTVRTAYDDADSVRALAEMGARVVRNDYAWTRTAAGRLSENLDGTVVVGSAMVADSLVRPERYREWLVTLASAGDATYLPHRRENARDVADYATIPGLRVYRPGIALELVLAQQPRVSRVVTLPSSVVATLTHILPETVALEMTPVPDTWWTETAAAEFRTMVRRIEENR
ncbi:hypothetical protein [Demequina salsinemoris]|uniref:hypothetical protein n=1 Tax=Demequina salsinemoris TaxID=577470 RepID=UPI000780916A|nr:hypothetical protein [Demequina salsinemoris]